MSKALELPKFSKEISLRGSGKFKTKKRFPETISYKIFETDSSFHLKQCTSGKVSWLIFWTFLLLLAKFSFWQGDWALGHQSIKFKHFRKISKFRKILNFKLFSNL